MKQLIVYGGIAVCGFALFSSCVSPASGRHGRAMLENVTVVPGGHCESSAIMNALRYEGYDVTECMITGGGGALDFSLQKGLFPFIGARNQDMRERFFAAANIGWQKRIPEGRETGWDEIAELLGRGVPVVLRVDMRFLPYRYGGKYGRPEMSFGWHMITLFGVDWDAGLAYVSDTEYAGLQSIKILDLEKARTSRTKNFPPRAEYYWAEPNVAPSGKLAASWDSRELADALARSSLDAVIGNYENGALEALSRFGADLSGFDSFSDKSFLYPAVFEYMAGTIEDFGTGGASFRVLYREFISYATTNGSRPELARLIPLLEGSIAELHALSSELRSASARVKSMSASGRREEFARLGKIADALYEREKALYTEMKNLREGV
jgi:hypothetical protein